MKMWELNGWLWDLLPLTSHLYLAYSRASNGHHYLNTSHCPKPNFTSLYTRRHQKLNFWFKQESAAYICAQMNRMLIRSEVEHFIHLTWAVLVTGQTGSGSVWNVPSWGCADCLWLLQNRLTGLKTLSPKMTCVGFGLNFYLENYNIPMYWVKSYTSL